MQAPQTTFKEMGPFHVSSLGEKRVEPSSYVHGMINARGDGGQQPIAWDSSKARAKGFAKEAQRKLALIADEHGEEAAAAAAAGMREGERFVLALLDVPQFARKLQVATIAASTTTSPPPPLPVLHQRHLHLHRW